MSGLEQLRDNFPLFAQVALKIRAKTASGRGRGNIIPLKLNRAQLYLEAAVRNDLETRGRVSIINVKGRQQGLSTGIGARIFHRVSQVPGQQAFIATHHGDSTEALFQMVHRYYQHLPDVLKPHKKYSSKRELYFDDLDSRYVVGTAGGQSIGRSMTNQLLHCSELAWWPSGTARDIYGGLQDSFAVGEGSMEFIESTANGTTGLFYDLWQGAVEGANDLLPVFIPWYWQPEYTSPAGPDVELTPEEISYLARFKDDGLTIEHLMWRRDKVGRKGLHLFHQEFPFTPDEAFVASGSQVFIPERLAEQRKEAKIPIKTMNFVIDQFTEVPKGPLIIYQTPQREHSYTIGADSGYGIKGKDYSVAHVVDEDNNVVAVWREYTEPSHFAKLLCHLGHMYNTARIVPESNNQGILTCHEIFHNYQYPNMYTEVVVDKITQDETTKIGFYTSVKTKPLLIGALRDAIRDNKVKIHHRDTIRECQGYMVTESGKMEGERGKHDDCVISLALAIYGNQGSVIDSIEQNDYYVNAL